MKTIKAPLKNHYATGPLVTEANARRNCTLSQTGKCMRENKIDMRHAPSREDLLPHPVYLKSCPAMRGDVQMGGTDVSFHCKTTSDATSSLARLSHIPLLRSTSLATRKAQTMRNI